MYYAVKNCGSRSGIYKEWGQVEQVIKGVSGVEFKKFKSEGDARRWMKGEVVGKRRYYAVISGLEVGVYGSWEETRDKVIGVSGAVYKGFATQEEAERYYASGGREERVELPEVGEDELVGYVDGSYNKATGEYGYGLLYVTGGEQREESGKGSKEELKVYGNVSGEVMGVVALMRVAYARGVKKVRIHYDYDGLEKWITGEWKAKSYVSKLYKAEWERLSEGVSVEWVKERAHTGLNMVVDRLAKKAVQ